ncbi:hypothetical protein JTE90_010665 [Oedothorax gibbosus]|uniref:Uncharacterized protein n=1 Tax=Oedothorax gibbosus TaxID=931172 RepID=A0AAV6UR39_9ARAC|nr:hypothetical protein JTE90_010665 [Oedothorax gibbosus]
MARDGDAGEQGGMEEERVMDGAGDVVICRSVTPGDQVAVRKLFRINLPLPVTPWTSFLSPLLIIFLLRFFWREREKIYRRCT